MLAHRDERADYNAGTGDGFQYAEGDISLERGSLERGSLERGRSLYRTSSLERNFASLSRSRVESLERLSRNFSSMEPGSARVSQELDFALCSLSRHRLPPSSSFFPTGDKIHESSESTDLVHSASSSMDRATASVSTSESTDSVLRSITERQNIDERGSISLERSKNERVAIDSCVSKSRGSSFSELGATENAGKEASFEFTDVEIMKSLTLAATSLSRGRDLSSSVSRRDSHGRGDRASLTSIAASAELSNMNSSLVEATSEVEVRT